jgi:hypothetical protein
VRLLIFADPESEDDPRNHTNKHETKPTRNAVRDVSCDFVDRSVLVGVNDN